MPNKIQTEYPCSSTTTKTRATKSTPNTAATSTLPIHFPNLQSSSKKSPISFLVSFLGEEQIRVSKPLLSPSKFATAGWLGAWGGGGGTGRGLVEIWEGLPDMSRRLYNLKLFTDRQTYEEAMEKLAKLENKTAHALAMEVIRNYVVDQQNGKSLSTSMIVKV
ncbi:hypothetical protein Droror1_Dr00007907 [Drosera rotundifolia]